MKYITTQEISVKIVKYIRICLIYYIVTIQPTRLYIMIILLRSMKLDLLKRSIWKEVTGEIVSLEVGDWG
jgi:hypothetical protein